MMDGEASPSRGLNYIINKTFAPGYFLLGANLGGDPSNYVAQWISTSLDEIRKYQWVALLLSNVYWTSLRSMRYYDKGATDIAPHCGATYNHSPRPERSFILA